MLALLVPVWVQARTVEVLEPGLLGMEPLQVLVAQRSGHQPKLGGTEHFANLSTRRRKLRGLTMVCRDGRLADSPVDWVVYLHQQHGAARSPRTRGKAHRSPVMMLGGEIRRTCMAALVASPPSTVVS